MSHWPAGPPPDENPTEDVFERERQLADARAAQIVMAIRRAGDNISGGVFVGAVIVAAAVLIQGC